MGNTYLDRPSGGPTLWLARWEEIINKAEGYEENLIIWLRDVCLVWEQVLDLIVYFQQHKAKHSEKHHGQIYASWNQLVITF